MTDTKKRVLSIILKGILLVVFHTILITFFYMSDPLVSDHSSMKIVLTSNQSEREFRLIPRRIEMFGSFEDATSNQWFKPLTKKDGKLIIEDVDASILYVQSYSNQGTTECWEINRSLENEQFYELRPISDQESCFSITSYFSHHIWKWIIIVLIFMIASWVTDKVLKSRFLYAELILLVGYVVYLYSEYLL